MITPDTIQTHYDRCADLVVIIDLVLKLADPIILTREEASSLILAYIQEAEFAEEPNKIHSSLKANKDLMLIMNAIKVRVRSRFPDDTPAGHVRALTLLSEYCSNDLIKLLKKSLRKAN